MIELTHKQAEYVEFCRKTLVDPEMMAFIENEQLINYALLVGYTVVDAEVTK